MFLYICTYNMEHIKKPWTTTHICYIGSQDEKGVNNSFKNLEDVNRAMCSYLHLQILEIPLRSTKHMHCFFFLRTYCAHNFQKNQRQVDYNRKNFSKDLKYIRALRITDNYSNFEEQTCMCLRVCIRDSYIKVSCDKEKIISGM